MKNVEIMYKYLMVIMLSSVLSISLMSCRQFVEIEPPKSRLIRETVFEDYSTAEAALVNIYGKLRENLSVGGLIRSCGLYADELTYYNTSPSNLSTQLIADNNLTSTHSYVASVWTNSYNLIYAANSIIEGAGASHTNLTPMNKDQLIGESLFIRSFVYCFLINLYGDIPYVTTTDYRLNTVASRQPVDEVYNFIEQDLLTAIDLLPEDYEDVERVRPIAATARALLARVYLYHQKWDAAEEIASTVISNPMFIWIADLDKVFLKSSPATIWQLKPNTDNGNTIDAQFYIFNTAPPTDIALNNDFVQSFSSEDRRLSYWMSSVSDDIGNKYYYAYKYKLNLPTTPSQEYSIQFRLVEQYLIRAEANLRMGNFAEARRDLNKIRQRAGLDPITTEDEQVLMDELMEERFHELFLEYPHRFFDLVRTGNTAILSARKPGWNDTDKLWPIPESELLVNPNLKPQNIGY